MLLYPQNYGMLGAAMPDASGAAFGAGPSASQPMAQFGAQGAASFGGAPAASFGGAPTASFGPTAAPTAPATPDMGQFLRGLDWSPQNASNATRQMTDAMGQYGWNNDQVGQELGFTGQQMQDHINKYTGAAGGSDPLQGFNWRNTTGDTRLYAQGGDGMAYIGGSPNWNPTTGTQFASGQGGPGVGNTGGMPANPYLPDMANDITRRTTDMMNQGIRQARGGALMAGGFGGSGQGIMEGKAISGSADNLAGQLGSLYGSAWNQDQGRDLQRYGMDQGFFGQQRGQDLQQAQLGASMLQQGLAAPWTPMQNASGVYSGYTGLGSTTTPGTGGGWQGALGGLLGGAQLARNFSWL